MFGQPSPYVYNLVFHAIPNYYLFDKGAYNITQDGKIHVNIDKVFPAAYNMLDEIIRVQIDDIFENAEKSKQDIGKN